MLTVVHRGERMQDCDEQMSAKMSHRMYRIDDFGSPGCGRKNPPRTKGTEFIEKRAANGFNVEKRYSRDELRKERCTFTCCAKVPEQIRRSTMIATTS